MNKARYERTVVKIYADALFADEYTFRQEHRADYFLIGSRIITGSTSSFLNMGYGDDSELVCIAGQGEWDFWIGKNEDNDLVVDVPIVSRRHARLYKERGDVLITDLNSSNGTFLNDIRVGNDPTVLKPNARIRFGPKVSGFNFPWIFHDYETLTGHIRFMRKRVQSNKRSNADQGPPSKCI